jgi:DNA-binding transcriptional ArsR family regulator
VTITAERADIRLQQRLMHGFADPSRLLIVDALRDGEQRVSDLSERVGLSRPNTSKHLACLLGCGVVVRERRGREVFYELSKGVDELLDAMDQLLDRVGDRVARCDHTTATMGTVR